jgi:hypothetical protein
VDLYPIDHILRGAIAEYGEAIIYFLLIGKFFRFNVVAKRKQSASMDAVERVCVDRREAGRGGRRSFTDFLHRQAIERMAAFFGQLSVS